MDTARSYRVIERLGEGAFGAVFLAESVGGGITRTVAIKVPHPERAGPDLVSRLRDEAQMLAMVRHRAIVRLDDLVELDGVWSVVMEFVDGADVAALLADGPIPVRAALAISEEIANALHTAWNQPGPEGRPLHLLHRDIKPSNIRVTPSGEVKLLDFGVARAEFDAREADATASVFGTPTYLAPERYHGTDTPAGDVYALGVTLFEMLTGVPPGKSAMDADRQPPGRKWADQWIWLGKVHPTLKVQLARMLAEDPASRPAARECARTFAEVRALIEGETLEDWAERAIADKARQKRTPDDRSGSLLTERSSSSTPRRRGYGWALAVCAIVLVVAVTVAALGAAGTALYATSNGHPPPPAQASPDAAALIAAPAPSPAPVAAPSVPPTPAVTPSTVPSPAPSPAPSAAPSPVPPVAPSPTPAAAPVTAHPATPHATATKPAPADVKPTVDPASLGSLVVSGDVQGCTLSGPASKPGNIPPGAYTAQVTLTNGSVIEVDGIHVTAGATTTVKCSATFGRCQVK